MFIRGAKVNLNILTARKRARAAGLIRFREYAKANACMYVAERESGGLCVIYARFTVRRRWFAELIMHLGDFWTTVEEYYGVYRPNFYDRLRSTKNC